MIAMHRHLMDVAETLLEGYSDVDMSLAGGDVWDALETIERECEGIKQTISMYYNGCEDASVRSYKASLRMLIDAIGDFGETPTWIEYQRLCYETLRVLGSE